MISFIFLIFYYICLSTIHHGQIHWKNIQTWSFPTLDSVNKGTCSFIFSFSNILIYLINNNVCPFCYGQKKNNCVLCSKNSIHNDLSITNNGNIKSCEHTKENKYRIPTTWNSYCHAQLVSETSVNLWNLHITMTVPPAS